MGDLKSAIIAIDARMRLQNRLSDLLASGKPAGVDFSVYCDEMDRVSKGLKVASRLRDEAMGTMVNRDFAIGIDDLELCFPTRKKDIPKTKGVYLLFSTVTYELDYIGKSKNLRSRPFYCHQHFDRSIHVAGYIVSPEPAILEEKLIRLNMPKLNIVIPNVISKTR